MNYQSTVEVILHRHRLRLVVNERNPEGHRPVCRQDDVPTGTEVLTRTDVNTAYRR